MKTDDLVARDTDIDTDAVAEPIDFNDAKIRYVVERCRGKSVLDLGCVMHDPRYHLNKWWLHRAIAEFAADLTGLDLSASGVRALRKAGYNVVQGDAGSFTFDRKFDVIVAGDLIEHLGNPSGMLESCLAALAPGGRIIIQTPNPWYWRVIIKAVLFREVPNNPEHTCWFDPRTLRQLAQRHGLTLGKTEFFSQRVRDRYMPLPGGIKHPSWATELVPIAHA